MKKMDLEHRIKELAKTLKNLENELKVRDQEIGALNYKIKKNKKFLNMTTLFLFFERVLLNISSAIQVKLNRLNL